MTTGEDEIVLTDCLREDQIVKTNSMKTGEDEIVLTE